MAERSEAIERPIHRVLRDYAAQKGYKDLIYLNIGEPDFPTPPHIIDAAKKALDEYNSGRVIEMIFLTHTEATYSSWFQKLGEASTAICFHKNRIKWIGDHTAYMQKDNEKPKEVHINDEKLNFNADYSIHGSVFFYFGPGPIKFCKVFRKWGFCKS